MSNIVYWEMRNGQLISIDDMDINHLRNTLKMIVNNSNKHQQKTQVKLNGDIANEFNAMSDDSDYGQDDSQYAYEY